MIPNLGEHKINRTTTFCTGTERQTIKHVKDPFIHLNPHPTPLQKSRQHRQSSEENMPGGFGSQTLDRLIAHWSPQSPRGDWSTPACMYQIISHSSRDILQSAPEACQASIIQPKHIHYIPYPHLHTAHKKTVRTNKRKRTPNHLILIPQRVSKTIILHPPSS